MLIPEVILYNTVKAFQDIVASDYKAASDKTQTILNDLFALDSNANVLKIENFNYLEQAIALFTRTEESPRQFQVNIGYNLNRAMLPTVHIMLPQESPGKYDAIGWDEGDTSTVYHPEANPQYELITRARTYHATFDLMITSDNSSEVLLIYYFIRAMLLYTVNTFELMGMHNYATTGQDIQLDPAYAPPNIFHRTIRIDFDYQSETKIRNYRQMANAINYYVCGSIGLDNTPSPPTFGATTPSPVPGMGTTANDYFTELLPAGLDFVILQVTHKIIIVKGVLVLDPLGTVVQLPVNIDQSTQTVEFTSTISLLGYRVIIF